MKIPAPTAKLAGCVWLPRILAKGRMLHAGTLSPEYAERFCSATGVDSQFLDFFGLTKNEVLDAALLSDAGAEEWFRGLPSATPERVEKWNHLAVNLGRAGFPMAERLPVALATTYANLDAKTIATVFEALEADEQTI